MSADVLLFVDLLGVRSRWQQGGRPEVEAVCRRFEDAVRSALSAQPAAQPTDGGMESDAAALVFGGADDAVAVGCELYRQVFRDAQSRHHERLWLRGAIVPYDKKGPLRAPGQLSRSLPQVTVYRCAAGLMDGIAVEKSGFKGMRLLIHPDLLSTDLSARFATKVGGMPFYVFKRLTFSEYPKCEEEHHVPYQDVLWMVGDSLDEWRQSQLSMIGRLRWAAKIPDEFLQAAATQVVFHECGAIIEDLQAKGP